MEQKGCLLSEILAKRLFSLVPKVIFLSLLLLLLQHVCKSDFLSFSASGGTSPELLPTETSSSRLLRNIFCWQAAKQVSVDDT